MKRLYDGPPIPADYYDTEQTAEFRRAVCEGHYLLYCFQKIRRNWNYCPLIPCRQRPEKNKKYFIGGYDTKIYFDTIAQAKALIKKGTLKALLEIFKKPNEWLAAIKKGSCRQD